METRTITQMNDEFRKFIQKHNNFKLETKSLGNDSYSKTFVFEDGAVWWEVNDIITREIKPKIYGIDIIASVELQRCEYWNTDDANSKFVFEQIRKVNA